MIPFINTKLKIEATSNIKIYQVLPSLSLNEVGNHLRDGPFEFDIEIGNLHPPKEHIGLFT